MGRKRSKEEKPKKFKKKGIVGYREEMIAVRWVSVDDNNMGFERVKQVMRVSLGLTTGEHSRFYFSNGECNDDEAGAIHISINGPTRDTVNMMFRAAIRKIGFKIEKGV